MLRCSVPCHSPRRKTRWNQLMSELVGQTVVDDDSSSSLAAPVMSLFTADDFGKSFTAKALYLTMLCAEMFPNSEGTAALSSILSQQEWQNDSMLIKATACESWPVEPVTTAARAAVSASTKVLLLSGENDIQTFSEWGELAAASLPEATHVVVPHATHITTSYDYYGDHCVGGVVAEFFRNHGAVESVDLSCIAEIDQYQAW